MTLKIAAKYASYTNFGGSPEEFAHKSEVLRGHCEALGRDFSSITRSTEFRTVIGTDAADVAARLDRIEARVAPYLGPEATARYMGEYRNDSPHTLVGTPAEIVAILDERRELGLGYAVIYSPEAAYDRSGLELFAAEVMPALR